MEIRNTKSSDFPAFIILFVTTVTIRITEPLKFEPIFQSVSSWAKLTDLEPGYPLSAAWFRDRYTLPEWDETLQKFQDIGGDTVILRSPTIVLQSREDFISDPNYQWCRVRRTFGYISCYDDAIEELSALGLKVSAVAKYDYEEDYSVKTIIRCPNYEKQINMSRKYYRLVFGMDYVSTESLRIRRDPCNLNGSHVMVLFTSFAGIDPHKLLLQTARARNLSVFFGLPQLPTWFNEMNPEFDFNYTVPLLQLTNRILNDHRERYSNGLNNLYDCIRGYLYSSDIQITSTFVTNSSYRKHLEEVGKSVQSSSKRFAISAFYQSNKLLIQSTMSDAITGFINLVKTGSVDVISVKDGRGSGNGAYFWQTELDSAVAKTDPVLYEILTSIDPNVTPNATFSSLFTYSLQQLFYNLALSRDLVAHGGINVDIWLNIEAFDNLHKDPCLPVDKAGSGLNQITNRITKSRLDHVLTHVGAYISKIAADAWDPCFTCEASFNSTLANGIKADYDRPVISNCSFHSTFNRSVVIIGYNLAGETQSFTVSWPDMHGNRQTSKVYGYFFELDWGLEHGRVPSLMYTQLYDPYDVEHLAPRGWVRVSAEGGYNSCTFVYDFDNDNGAEMKSGVDSLIKKFYLRVQSPKPRIYAHNVPFAVRSKG